MSAGRQGVSFVVPVHNGERWLDDVLTAIMAQQLPRRPLELVLVEDGSTDGSEQILQRWARRERVVLLQGKRQGAAAATNLGIRHASHPVVCQVDQDVILQPGWLACLLEALERSEDVAAAQGYYATDPADPLWARVMGRDLELRYSRIQGRYVDHVCTGNSVYRAQSLQQVGLFDESLGYGYDNDMSYRLGDAGFKLAFCPKARSVHRWRPGLWGYLVQQYGVGYGRLDLVAKHRGRRVKGDDVSGLRMILHVPLMLAALLALGLGAAVALAGLPWAALPVAVGSGLLGLLGLDRLVAGVQAYRRFGDPACFAFVLVHLLRDLAWVAALLRWSARRLGRRPRQPRDSMLRP